MDKDTEIILQENPDLNKRIEDLAEAFNKEGHTYRTYRKYRYEIFQIIQELNHAYDMAELGRFEERFKGME